jgi:TolB protein
MNKKLKVSNSLSSSKKTSLLILVLTSLISFSSLAEVEFVITESSASAVTIGVLPFKNNNQAIQLNQVISNDLQLTGQFKSLAKEQMIENPSSIKDINFTTWKMLGVDYVTVGSIKKTTQDRVEIDLKLFSVLDQKQMMSLVLPIYTSEFRSGAHYMADRIYEKITGVKGIFSTKIAYVTATKGSAGIDYQLMVADADGKNAQALVTSKQPLLSPRWSPRGDQLVYVSFEKGNSAVYVQDLATGKRTLMSNYKGINSGASFSPDGKTLSLTLSKSGNAEIYTMDIMTKTLRKITDSRAIDTNANWSPDGMSLVFTSDRGGKPNLYKVDLNTLNTTRLTFEGDYNAGGSYSPNGEYICYVQGNKNDYRIALRHNKSETSQIISEGKLDETPTFAPNNDMVLYASKNAKGQGILISTSLDGSTKNQLIVSNGHIREPSWSPVIN